MMTYSDGMMSLKMTEGYYFKVLILGAEDRGLRAKANQDLISFFEFKVRTSSFGKKNKTD